MSRRRAETWLIVPPAKLMTRTVAVRWLKHQYPALAALARAAGYPDAIRWDKREREDLFLGLRMLAGDVSRITEIAGRVIADGRPRPMRMREDWTMNPPRLARQAKILLRFEMRNRSWSGRPGCRKFLRQAQKTHERAVPAWRAERRKMLAQ